MATGKLDAYEFARLLDANRDDILAACDALIAQYDFRYNIIVGEEFETTVLKVLKAIDSGELKPSGVVRKNDWEKGWKENLDAFIASGYDISALAPKYISKHDVSRLFSRYVRPRDQMFELNFYTVFRHWLFKTYLGSYQNIFEFGCGSGYNLAIMNNLFPEKQITGLDWAESSVAIANTLGQSLNAKISGRSFDYFNPDYSLNIQPDSLVITLNSLEQLGSGHEAFLDFLLDKKPALCINSEPILELYDDNDLFDYLAIRYHKARNYLSGYYTALLRLEAAGRIRIVKTHRIPFGNLFHEGYSLIIWRVLR